MLLRSIFLAALLTVAGAGAALAGTTEQTSKLNNYSVLVPAGPQASKLNNYSVLVPAGPQASKLNAYAALENIVLSVSKYNGYTVLVNPPAGTEGVSKLNGYTVLVNPPAGTEGVSKLNNYVVITVYGLSKLNGYVVISKVFPNVEILQSGSIGPPPLPKAFVTGETLGTIRNNYVGAVGFQLVVGAASITVQQLGRWVVSGNTQSHTISIYNSACGNLGSVTVNTSGATPGKFLYGTLVSPVALTAGQTYYVMSAENNGGDQWYDADTTLTNTAVGTVPHSTYGGCTLAGGATTSYVPVDFKYTSP